MKRTGRLVNISEVVRKNIPQREAGSVKTQDGVARHVQAAEVKLRVGRTIKGQVQSGKGHS